MEINKEIHNIEGLSDECNDKIFDSWGNLTDKMMKFQESVNEALELNDMNIADKAMVSTKIVSNFIASYYGELMLLEKMKEALPKVENETLEKLKKEKKFEGAEYYLNDKVKENPRVKKIKKAIRDQDFFCKFAFTHLTNLQKYGFSIKNSVEILKLEN